MRHTLYLSILVLSLVTACTKEADMNIAKESEHTVKKNLFRVTRIEGHSAAHTVLPHRSHAVRNKNQGRRRLLCLKSCIGLAAKRRITDGVGFVDQIKIKTDGHGKPESQLASHAGRVGLHGHVHVVTELGKIFHILGNFTDIRTIDP